MIFVTVGTHEQPFNRLIKKVDDLVANGNIKEKVIVQTGFSTYIPIFVSQILKQISSKDLKNMHFFIVGDGP